MVDIKNSKMFVEFAKILKESGIELEYESDFDFYRKHKKVKITNTPYIGDGYYNGNNGFYFRKKDYTNWSLTDVLIIRDVFNDLQYDSHVANLVDVDPMDWDDDRVWKATIAFTISKNNKNILD